MRGEVPAALAGSSFATLVSPPEPSWSQVPSIRMTMRFMRHYRSVSRVDASLPIAAAFAVLVMSVAPPDGQGRSAGRRLLGRSRTHGAPRVRPRDIFFGFLRLLSRDIAI